MKLTDRAELLEKAKLFFPKEYQDYSGLYSYLIPVIGRFHWKKIELSLILAAERSSSERVSRILDVGCGFGFMLYHLDRFFPRYIGVGIDIHRPEVLQSIRLFGGSKDFFFTCDANHLPFKPGCFDVIFCTDVLEHLDQPVDALLEIRRLLSPEGVLILGLPVENILLKTARAVWYGLQREKPEYHYKGTHRSFEKLREEVYQLFEVEETIYFPYTFLGKSLNYGCILVCRSGL